MRQIVSRHFTENGARKHAAKLAKYDREQRLKGYRRSSGWSLNDYGVRRNFHRRFWRRWEVYVR